ncbi:uncharacterized protein LOC125594011 [Brassica napus]|nr:uncharacterized protein LOC106412779 [Brassica napus]XP_048626290.1 uncharacterized protein LOC125594011 [Brassica napus]
MADRNGWHFTNNGKFTVKSGYQVERTYPDRDRLPLFIGPTVDVIKAFCWKIRCPPKIKHFLWQFVSGSVAVKKNLQARGMQGDISCARCGADEESINHVFFECPPAIQLMKDQKMGAETQDTIPQSITGRWCFTDGSWKEEDMFSGQGWFSTLPGFEGLMGATNICTPKEKGGLGFRDFKNFNLALLAKQLWRLVQYPNSLLARELKGRYYRLSDPIEVSKASKPSYVWRSLMAAQTLLKKGIRKSIGTGDTTLVWADPWIPSTPARPAIPRRPSFNPALRVADLLDPISKDWQHERLRELVIPSDIPLIRSLRPTRSTRPPSYCWNLTKSGVYSVKSGYQLAMDSLDDPEPDKVLKPSITALQAKVWTLKTTKKIKHFIWQALSNCIPVCNALSDRHCGTDRCCPRCGSDEETINHLLFECPPSVQAWALADIPYSPGSFPSSSIYSNLDHVLWRASDRGIPETILAAVPWVLWYIWKARNDKTFNGKEITPLETTQLARAEAESWRLAQIIDEPAEEIDGDTRHAMATPPPRTGPVCYTDASWHKDDTYFGGGMVLLTEDGTTTFGSFASNRVLTPLHAEFQTLLWAMKSSLQLDHSSMTFETDCLQLVNLIEEDDEDKWPSLLAEFDEFHLIRSMFTFCSISFISRSLNIRADLLAKGARTRGFTFSHVNSQLPSWMAQSANLREFF